GSATPTPTASPTRRWTPPPSAAGRPTAAARNGAPARLSCGDALWVLTRSRSSAERPGRKRLSLEEGRAGRAAAPGHARRGLVRKVRAPQGRVVGNADPG